MIFTAARSGQTVAAVAGRRLSEGLGRTRARWLTEMQMTHLARSQLRVLLVGIQKRNSACAPAYSKRHLSAALILGSVTNYLPVVA